MTDGRLKRPVTMGALFGTSDTPDREVPCCDCGETIVCPGFIVDEARKFNHRLLKSGTPKDELIMKSDVIACSDCREVREHEHETQANNRYLDARRLLLLAKKGTQLDGEEVRWLHEIGSGDTLNSILAKQKKLSGRSDDER